MSVPISAPSPNLLRNISYCLAMDILLSKLGNQSVGTMERKPKKIKIHFFLLLTCIKSDNFPPLFPAQSISIIHVKKKVWNVKGKKEEGNDGFLLYTWAHLGDTLFSCCPEPAIPNRQRQKGHLLHSYETTMINSDKNWCATRREEKKKSALFGLLSFPIFWNNQKLQLS